MEFIRRQRQRLIADHKSNHERYWQPIEEWSLKKHLSWVANVAKSNESDEHIRYEGKKVVEWKTANEENNKKKNKITYQIRQIEKLDEQEYEEKECSKSQKHHDDGEQDYVICMSLSVTIPGIGM